MSSRLYVTAGVVLLVAAACAFAGISATQNTDDQGFSCANLPSFSALKAALTTATATEASGLNILPLFGTIEYGRGYDYKKERTRKRA